MNAPRGISVTQQLSQQGWWALPLPFCLKVFGFHQLKKSRQGQGRWMTSMASRYFQGRVIETNEPCYISWDTESCCSKIQSLIELKLEAPNLSTDHRCHGAREEELSQSACFAGLTPPPPFFCFSLGPHLLCSILYQCTHTHKHTQTLWLHGLQRLFWPFLGVDESEIQPWSNLYTIHLSISVYEHFLHSLCIPTATKCTKWLHWHCNNPKYICIVGHDKQTEAMNFKGSA